MKKNSNKTLINSSDHDLQVVGKVQRAQGMKGELRIQLFTAHPDHLARVESIYLKINSAVPILYTVDNAHWDGSKFIFKLHGIDDRNTAEALRGSELYLPDELAYRPEEDEYFVEDLIGMDVIDIEGTRLGKISDILNYPAHDIYVITGDKKKKEILVPAVREYVREVNMDTGTIMITLIDGLVD